LLLRLRQAETLFFRTGLHTDRVCERVGLLAIAGIVLFAYGYAVNTPPWDFGKLLGLYVVFFFTFAQLISCLFFKQPRSTAVLIGGSLIVVGGMVIAAATA